MGVFVGSVLITHAGPTKTPIIPNTDSKPGGFTHRAEDVVAQLEYNPIPSRSNINTAAVTGCKTVYPMTSVHCVLGDVGWTSPISGACLCLMPDMGAPMNVLMYVTIVLCTVS
jgi:hypothetical protein